MLRKVIALIATAALVVLGLMFSAVIFAVIVVIGLSAWAYLWWKTRALRRRIREHQLTMEADTNETASFKGEIIEGEVIRKTVIIEEIKR